MNFKVITSICVATVFMQVALAFQLEHGKQYTIGNGLDNLYLTAVDNTVHCKKRGDVITSTLVSPITKPQTWTYYANKAEGWDFLMGQYGNEISLENKPPYCNFAPQPYKLTPSGKGFTVKHTDTKKCLAGTGKGKRISWEECKGGSQKQVWNFAEVH